MSEVSFGKTVSLKQAAQLILTNPNQRFLLRGEPGIGKSSILEFLAAETGYDTAYIDVPNLDLGDVAMPVVNKEKRVTEYYPNSRFKLHLGKPVIVMFDEITKGSPPVVNMVHPMFEKVNPRLGDVPVPLGSLVFMTGNLTTDGVGDTLKAHTLNRIVALHVRKPSAEEWIEWAIAHDIDPVVVAWVSRFPHVMASYTDAGQTDNPYIFNPKRPSVSYVSPRSLATASDLVKSREHNDRDAVLAGLAGTIGEAGARDLAAFVEFSDQLPAWETIITKPEDANVPTAPGACAVSVFGAISRVDKATITPFMKYLSRFSAEWQAVFAINIAKNPQKQAIAFSSKAFADWVAKNQDLL